MRTIYTQSKNLRAFGGALLWTLAIIVASVLPAQGQSMLPEGKGKETVESVCSECHGLKQITEKRLTRDEWKELVNKMIENGAVIPPDDLDTVIDYLAKNFPKEGQKEESASQSGEKKEAEAEAKGDAAKGKDVFATNCALCHNAESADVLVGPGLKGLFHWPPHKLSDGTEHKEHTVEIIRKQIVEGGGAMMAVGAGLSAQELQDLIAYLQTL